MSLKDSLHIWKKKLLIKLKSRKGRKGKITSVVNIAILVLSILLFVLVLCPTLIGRMPFYDFFIENGVFPYRLNLSGQIVIEMNNNEVKENKCVDIYIGGFSTKSTKEGDFELQFIAENPHRVPILMVYCGKEYWFYTDFDDKEKEEEYTIHVE